MGNPAPLAIGSHQALGGGTGLRQGNLPVVFPDPGILNTGSGGLLIFFLSPSGEQVAYIQAGRGEAARLDYELSYKKYGGLQDFSMNVLRDNKFPLFTGMNIRFLYNNNPIGFGYVEETPTSDQDSGLVKIKGSGFAKKLKDKKINLTVSGQTVNSVIDTLGSNYFSELGFNYNPFKNQAPGTVIEDANWKNKSIEQIIQDLISISNENFSTVEYIYGVDPEGDFYFNGISQDQITAGYFEGFSYQNAATEEDARDLVNLVEIYRTTEADSKETEYVSTVQDSDSIDNNGIYDRKLTISDFVDDTTAGKVAAGIIANQKDVKNRVTVSELLIEDFLPWGYYALNNKKQTQKTVVSDFSSLSDWAQSVTTSTVSLTSTNVFSGRQCYKWETASSLGDTLTKEVEYYTPSFLRLYVRQTEPGEYLQITVNGLKGRTLTPIVTDTTANLETDTGLDVLAQEALSTETTESLTLNVPTAREWVYYDLDLTGYFKIDSIELEIVNSGTAEILIDRMELYSEAYVKRVLSLETLTYKFGKTSLKVPKAVFGQEKITLTERLNKIDKKNTIAFDIFSKQ